MTQNQNQQIVPAPELPQQHAPEPKLTTIPPLPHWPTSRPGPMVTDAPHGQRRLLVRSDQLIEIDYDQEHGQSSVREKEKHPQLTPVVE